MGIPERTLPLRRNGSSWVRLEPHCAQTRVSITSQAPTLTGSQLQPRKKTSFWLHSDFFTNYNQTDESDSSHGSYRVGMTLFDLLRPNRLLSQRGL